SRRVLQELERNGQIVLQYTDPSGKPAPYPDNPNGSEQSIAGICNPTGRVFGLMPHPEAATQITNHPRWTRETLEEPLSRQIFANAVAAAIAPAATEGAK